MKKAITWIGLGLMFFAMQYNQMGIIYAQTETTNNGYVTDLDLALEISKDTKQEIILVFSASWCSFCKLLKSDLPELSGFDNKIICIVDVDSEKRLARQFRAKTLPTSIRLNSNGNELGRIVGYEKIPYSKWLENKK